MSSSLKGLATTHPDSRGTVSQTPKGTFWTHSASVQRKKYPIASFQQGCSYLELGAQVVFLVHNAHLQIRAFVSKQASFFFFNVFFKKIYF